MAPRPIWNPSAGSENGNADTLTPSWKNYWSFSSLLHQINFYFGIIFIYSVYGICSFYEQLLTLIQHPIIIRNGMRQKIVNALEIIAGGLFSGCLNVCWISGLMPSTMLVRSPSTLGFVSAATSPGKLSSTSAKYHAWGFEITASPIMRWISYLPDFPPNSFAFALT